MSTAQLIVRKQDMEKFEQLRANFSATFGISIFDAITVRFATEEESRVIDQIADPADVPIFGIPDSFVGMPGYEPKGLHLKITSPISPDIAVYSDSDNIRIGSKGGKKQRGKWRNKF